MKKWLFQARIEILRNVRNRRFFFFSVLLPIGFYFLYVHLIGANKQVGGVAWAKYYMISMATFGVVGAGLNGLSSRIAYERTQGWLRLIQTTPQRASYYMTTKIVGNLMVNVAEVLLLFLAGALVEHVRMPITEWILAGLWISFGGLAFIVLGILIGQLAGMDAAQIVASALYFILSITGGLWFPISLMGSFMQRLASWMPTYHLAHMAWALVGNQKPVANDFYVLFAYLVGFGLIAWWVSNRRPEARVS